MKNTDTQKTLLLTGSQGFTSKYLREAFLKEGYQVWGLVKEHPSQEPREWEVCADLMRQEELRQVVAQIAPNYVIHLAGISSVTHESGETLYQINCQGTLNLLSALQKENIAVKKIILASSAYVYGNASSIFSEKNCPNPVNHYAMSKLAMEYMTLNYFKNLPIVIARPFNYTGVGQQNHVLIPKIVHHFLTKASKIHLGNLHVYREFNDVRMVVEAYQGLLNYAEPGTTVNICTGNSHSLHEILELCEKISQHSLEICVNPQFVRKDEATHLSGDPTLLHHIVPNLPLYTLEDTLRWMLKKT